MSAFCLLALLLIYDQPTANSSPSPSPSLSEPPPVISVSLERPAIREGDEVPVSISFSNQGNQELTGVEVEITRPNFLTLSVAECDGKLANSKLMFGAVQPNSSVNCKLNLRTTQDIVVGDYNLLFTFQYGWRVKDLVRKSFVTVEKPLTVNFLGSDR